jgi:hypothetical protein
MHDPEMVVELRFGRDAAEYLENGFAQLRTLNPERGAVARDPTILAALTLSAAAISLTTELVKFAKELRSRGKTGGILLVKLDKKNEEVTLPLLESTETEIQRFISHD